MSIFMCDEAELELFNNLEDIFLNYRDTDRQIIGLAKEKIKKQDIDNTLVKIYEKLNEAPSLDTFLEIDDIAPFSNYLPRTPNSPLAQHLEKIEDFLNIGLIDENIIPKKDITTYEGIVSSFNNDTCSSHDYYKRIIIYSLRVKLVAIYNKKILLLKLRDLQNNEAIKSYRCFGIVANISHLQNPFYNTRLFDDKSKLAFSIVMHSALLETNSCSYLDTTYMDHTNPNYRLYSVLLIRGAAAMTTGLIVGLTHGLAAPAIAILGLIGGYIVSSTGELVAQDKLIKTFNDSNLKYLAKKELIKIANEKISLMSKTIRENHERENHERVEQELNNFEEWNKYCSKKYLTEITEKILKKYSDYDKESYNHFDKYELLFNIYLSGFATCMNKRKKCNVEVRQQVPEVQQQVPEVPEVRQQVPEVRQQDRQPMYHQDDIVYYYGTDVVRRGKRVKILNNGEWIENILHPAYKYHVNTLTQRGNLANRSDMYVFEKDLSRVERDNYVVQRYNYGGKKINTKKYKKSNNSKTRKHK